VRHCLEQVSSHRWLPGVADDRNESFGVFQGAVYGVPPRRRSGPRTWTTSPSNASLCSFQKSILDSRAASIRLRPGSCSR